MIQLPQPREGKIYHIVSTGIYSIGLPFVVEVCRLPLTERHHHRHQATTPFILRFENRCPSQILKRTTIYHFQNHHQFFHVFMSTAPQFFNKSPGKLVVLPGTVVRFSKKYCLRNSPQICQTRKIAKLICPNK